MSGDPPKSNLSPLREVVLDTETTGLSVRTGHRIIEIGCLELIDHQPTSRTFQCYINPKFPVSERAFEVHHLSNKFLEGFPTFDGIVQDFRDFIQEDTLIIHNGHFDIKFINNEFQKLNIPEISFERVIDTMLMARKLYPRQPASLDSLCDRFNIDKSSRSLGHGALTDVKLLQLVYAKLLKDQDALGLNVINQSATQTSKSIVNKTDMSKQHRPAQTAKVDTEKVASCTNAKSIGVTKSTTNVSKETYLRKGNREIFYPVTKGYKNAKCSNNKTEVDITKKLNDLKLER
ncbi:uncharacterized protein TRIADDRAFT_55196 [Trichoplax adhaerens]|uniref:DNA polymerase III subunit epsilon n=1 Tax=Trichoplax adhaerens TaxID=10228 RepID=B3RU88_TRIAD|nr:hypothetical protein TRIADDRAFT_55196 [Trichoplax adhaerens]EDV25766.1 hypothetical protein TRIADDRAFT_55196 [Trichoplax adhaerens]|eukprot:XP_002111799.1 hypothetical protein TRIADDRAFT_55196 [Trichoplax adhaerens]